MEYVTQMTTQLMTGEEEDQWDTLTDDDKQDVDYERWCAEQDDETVASIWGTVKEKTNNLRGMTQYTEQEWKHYWEAKYGI